MSLTVAMVSLRCNPAFLQHLIAYAKLIKELGHQPVFLLDPDYRRFSELEQAATIVYADRLPLKDPLTHAVFLNPSVNNMRLAKQLKHAGTRILYVYHEPWQMSRAYIRDEGLRAAVKATLAHRATVPVLRIADTVILESEYGLRIYKKSDARFNHRCVYLPQIYDDEVLSDVSTLLSQKRYFGFIGTLCRSHGFDQYLSIMSKALRRGVDFQFLIASRNPFPKHILKDPLFRQNLDKIEIRCGRPLHNDEMNRCYAECFCVWNLYRRSTQSGVLPKAFMFGAPVIASAIGSFPEYIQEAVNGRFAQARDVEGICKALEEMRANIDAYAINCRRTFLETFFYRSRLSDFEQLL